MNIALLLLRCFLLFLSNNSGNVGIGVPKPSDKLHVDGDLYVNGVLKLKPKQISEILTANDAGADDYFGWSVALSSDGSVLLVGATDWDGSAPDQSTAGSDPFNPNKRGGVYTYSLEANSFPLSVSYKGYGLNVINDDIVLNSDVEVTGSISEDGTLLSAKYAPIDIETSKWTDIATGIYRDSKIGIGNFSSTALTEKLELRSTSGDSFIKITDVSDHYNNEIGMIFEKTHTNLYDFKIMNVYVVVDVKEIFS